MSGSLLKWRRRAGPVAPEQLDGGAAFLRALGHDYLGYLISLGLLNLGNLLLLPLLTAYLSPAGLGLYSLVETALQQGLTLGLLGLKFAYLYYYAQADATGDSTLRPALLGATLLLSTAASTAIGLLLWAAFADPGLLSVFDAAPLPQAWLLVPLLVSGAVQTILLTELRAARHVWLSGTIAVAQLALWLLLSAVLVIGYDAGLPGLLAAQALAQIIACGTGYGLLAGRIRLRGSLVHGLKLLRYGLPMMTGLSLRYSLDTLSRFLLAALVSIEAAGQFMVVARVATLFEALLALPFFTAWGGLVHHALRRPDAGHIIGRVSSIALAAGALLLLTILALQAPLFRLLAHDAMPQLAGAFALLLLVKAVQLVKSPLSAGILLTGQTGWAVRNNLFALAIFLVLCYPMSHVWGLTGMTFAMLCATVAPMLTLGVAASRHCRQRIDHTALAAAGLAAAIAAATAWLDALPATLYAGGLVLAALLALIMTRHIRVAAPQ